MAHKGLNRLVRRLLADRDFCLAFARDPETNRRKYSVSKQQLQALLDADQERLIALGLDPEILQSKEEEPNWLPSALIRLGGMAAALLLAALLSLAGGGSAYAQDGGSGVGIVVRRVGRSQRARNQRVIVHPLSRKAIERFTRTKLRYDRYLYRTSRKIANFARKQHVFGSYSDLDQVMDALRNVDPNIEEVITIK